MKRAVLFTIALSLACTTTLIAQNVSSAPDSKSVVALNDLTRNTNDLSGTACPVSMHALQGTGYGLVKVRGEQPIEGPAQRIHLVLVNPKTKQFASAKVIVRGLSPKSHGLLTGNARPADLNKTLEVTFVPEDEKTVSAELVLPGFTSVTSIELQSVTYQDGSTWSLADHQTCRVAPDPFMLIANQ